MAEQKDSMDDLASALEAKLESEGTPPSEEVIGEHYAKTPLGERQTVSPSRRLDSANLKRKAKKTNLDLIIKATLANELPKYFQFPSLSQAYSLRSMVSSYLSQEIKSRIVVRVGRPTQDDSVVIVGVFAQGSGSKGWLQEAIKMLFAEKDDK